MRIFVLYGSRGSGSYRIETRLLPHTQVTITGAESGTSKTLKLTLDRGVTTTGDAMLFLRKGSKAEKVGPQHPKFYPRAAAFSNRRLMLALEICYCHIFYEYLFALPSLTVSLPPSLCSSPPHTVVGRLEVEAFATTTSTKSPGRMMAARRCSLKESRTHLDCGGIVLCMN